jgi:hypothetical protein
VFSQARYRQIVVSGHGHGSAAGRISRVPPWRLKQRTARECRQPPAKVGAQDSRVASGASGRGPLHPQAAPFARTCGQLMKPGQFEGHGRGQPGGSQLRQAGPGACCTADRSGYGGLSRHGRRGVLWRLQPSAALLMHGVGAAPGWGNTRGRQLHTHQCRLSGQDAGHNRRHRAPRTQ